MHRPNPTHVPPQRTLPHRLRTVIAATTLLSVCAGFAPASLAATPPRPKVLTSFLPVHSVAVAVAGNRATVENWLPTGVDPHDFQFSPADLRRLRAAHLLIVGGLGLEGWTEDKLRRISGNAQLRLVEAAAGLPESALIRSEGGHAHDHDHDHDHSHDHDHGPADGGPNPHFWLDPLLLAHAVTNVATALSAVDPAGAETYQANANSHVAALHRLHADLEAGLRDCRDTAFITAHDAFPYLARRYQLRLVGVVESGNAGDASARALAELSQTVRREKARVLFTDGPPTRVARRLASDLGLKLGRLETLETGDLKPGAYEAGMRRNLAALREALGVQGAR